MQTNDNDTAPQGPLPPAADPHGHAALLLVESLIHGLLDRAVITREDAIEIVEIANDVQVEIAEASDGASGPMWRSHTLLSAIGQSLLKAGEGPGPQPVP